MKCVALSLAQMQILARSSYIAMRGLCTLMQKRSPQLNNCRSQSWTGQAAAMGHAPHALPTVSWDPQVFEYLSASFGSDQFDVLQRALASPPLHTCVRVNTLTTTPQEVLHQLHVLLGDPQPSSHQDHPPSSSSRYHIKTHPQVPEAVLLQGSGPHPVDLSQVSKQVLISRKAGEAVLRGAQVFVPGVLACSAGVSAGDTVAVMIEAAAGAGITRGMVLPTIQEQQQQQQQDWVCAGVGRARVGRVDMFRLQQGVAVELTDRLYDVPSLNGQLQGSVMLQNLPSIVAALALNPSPGSRVLDMCAAPGGKTTMLAQIMGGKGQIYALDRSHAKVDDIRSLAAELGCSSCITALKMDATKAVAAAESSLGQEAAATAAAGGEKQQQCHSGNHKHQHQQEQKQEQEQQQQQQHGQLPPLLMSQTVAQDLKQESVQQGVECPQTVPHNGQQQHPPQQQQQQQQQPPHQQQQQQHEPSVPQGMSAKAQQRLSRRLAAMAARGHQPSPREFRSCGAAPAVPKHPGFAAESFEYVLLDAPCTALGLRPKLQQPLSLQQVLEAATYQRQLLAAAVQLVRPGGFLVYSTCSISPAENELNVRHVLDTFPCLKLVASEPRVGGPGLTGPADAVRFREVLQQAASSCDRPNPSVIVAAAEAAWCVGSGADGPTGWLSKEEALKVQRFYPGTVHDTIGFFLARFQKSCKGC